MIKTSFNPANVSNIDNWYLSMDTDLSLNETRESLDLDLDNDDSSNYNNDDITNDALMSRNSGWRRSVVSRYRRCIITGLDKVECDAAHIVPHHECIGLKKDLAHLVCNGLLLSKNLHWTFDRYLWSLDPNDIVKETVKHVWIRIVVKNTKKRLSILSYYKPHVISHESFNNIDMCIDDTTSTSLDSDDIDTYGYVKIYKDSIPYIRVHYEKFLCLFSSCNECEICYILGRKKGVNGFIYFCVDKSGSFSSGKWLTKQEGVSLYGDIFLLIIERYDDGMEEKEDPTWTPKSV